MLNFPFKASSLQAKNDVTLPREFGRSFNPESFAIMSLQPLVKISCLGGSAVVALLSGHLQLTIVLFPLSMRSFAA